MLGWGRKRQGFEWREYVRTTILLKRKKRRDRVAAARQAAADGLKEAGRKGAHASAAAARATGAGISRTATTSAAWILDVLKASGQTAFHWSLVALRSILGAAAAVLRALHRAGTAAIAALPAGFAATLSSLHSGRRSGNEPAMDPLDAPFTHRPSPWNRLPAILGGIAGLVAAPFRWLFAGIGALIGQIAARELAPTMKLLGAGLLGASAMGMLMGGAGAFSIMLAIAGLASMLAGSGVLTPLKGQLSKAAETIGDNIDRMETRRLRYASAVGGAVASTVVAGLIGAGAYAAAAPFTSQFSSLMGSSSDTPQAPVRKAVAMSGDASAGVSGSWGALPAMLSMPELPGLPSLSNLNPFAAHEEVVTGRARAMSGDTLRLGDRIIKLDGIEAPEYRQTCSRPGARRWRCGVSAERALGSLLRPGTVTCRVTGKDEAGFDVADCTARDRNIAAELVSEGHVFAVRGFFAPYTALEDAARKDRRGVWRGEAARPSAYREARWKKASEQVPDGCPIKGRSSGRYGKIYVLPWSVSYERIRVRESRGDRWFCSESEARAAGWRPYRSL